MLIETADGTIVDTENPIEPSTEETRSDRAYRLAAKYYDRLMDAAEQDDSIAIGVLAQHVRTLNELAAIARQWEIAEHNAAVLR